MSLVRDQGYCLNCLRPGHYVRQCQSHHKCKRCQWPHHSLLHLETPEHSNNSHIPPPPTPPVNSVLTHTTTGLPPNSLFMTCEVVVNGSTIRARALLDSASSISFISERLVRSLSLPRSPSSIKISGVAGLTHKSSLHSVATFTVSPATSSRLEFPTPNHL